MISCSINCNSLSVKLFSHSKYVSEKCGISLMQKLYLNISCSKSSDSIHIYPVTCLNTELSFVWSMLFK